MRNQIRASVATRCGLLLLLLMMMMMMAPLAGGGGCTGVCRRRRRVESGGDAMHRTRTDGRARRRRRALAAWGRQGESEVGVLLRVLGLGHYLPALEREEVRGGVGGGRALEREEVPLMSDALVCDALMSH